MHCKQAAIHSADVAPTAEHPVIAAFAAESSSPSFLLPAESNTNTDSGKRKQMMLCGLRAPIYHHLLPPIPSLN